MSAWMLTASGTSLQYPRLICHFSSENTPLFFSISQNSNSLCTVLDDFSAQLPELVERLFLGFGWKWRRESEDLFDCQMASPSLTGTVLRGKWRLGALLGTGACADVYEATDVSAGAASESGGFVAKVTPLTSSKDVINTIYWENTLHQAHLRPLRNRGFTVQVGYAFADFPDSQCSLN